MYFSRFLKVTEIKDSLKKNVAGIPVIYDKKDVYSLDSSLNNLVIGSMGSGKTQAVILPLLKSVIKAKESVLISDINGELYKNTKDLLEKNKYKTIKIDFSEKENLYNPFTIAYENYKENKIDNCIKLLSALGYYIFNEEGRTNADPFWQNMGVDYFIGISLYCFNQGKIPTFNDVFLKAYEINENGKKVLEEVKEEKIIFQYLYPILSTPPETKASIVAVATQKIKEFAMNSYINEILGESDFDLSDIMKGNMAIFIIGKRNDVANKVIPIMVSQVYELASLSKKIPSNINIILDDFNNLVPFYDFERILNYSRSLNLRFTIVVNNLIELISKYGRETAELIKMCFGNIIYLLSNDLYTLEEVSRWCGNKNEKESLISVNELKVLQPFEAVILVVRHMPYKIKLVPDYKVK